MIAECNDASASISIPELPAAARYMPNCAPCLLRAAADVWVVRQDSALLVLFDRLFKMDVFRLAEKPTYLDTVFGLEGPAEQDALELMGVLDDVGDDLFHLIRHMPFGTYAVCRPGGTWIVTSTILADAGVRSCFTGVGESFEEALKAAYGERLEEMYSPDNFHF